jgi:hypothetical protein
MCYSVFCHSSLYAPCCDADSYFGILATIFVGISRILNEVLMFFQNLEANVVTVEIGHHLLFPLSTHCS